MQDGGPRKVVVASTRDADGDKDEDCLRFEDELLTPLVALGFSHACARSALAASGAALPSRSRHTPTSIAPCRGLPELISAASLAPTGGVVERAADWLLTNC